MGNVDVEPGVTLTVQAGTVVQFNNGTSLTVDGTLLAQGTVSHTIFFTSVNDNSTTGGGNTATPGNWGNITFESDSSGSILTDTEVAYGGSFGGPMVEDIGGSLTLSSSAINDSDGAGVRLQQSTAVLTADTFAQNRGAAVSMDLDSIPAITGEAASSFTANSVNGLLVDGGSLAESLSWNNPDIVYALGGNLAVPKGMTLSIGAGQIIKSGGPSLSVDGTLDAQGTTALPVIFTSIKDDSSGGDTNDDGTSTSPGPGNWGSVQLNADSTNNALNNVEILYAGFVGGPALYDDGAPLVFSGGAVSDSDGPGIRLVQSTAALTAITFANNVGAAVSMDLDSNPTISGESTSIITGNGNNGLVLDQGNLAENLTWNNPSIVYTLSAGIDVPNGMTLSIGPGQIIKSGRPSLTVDGTLDAQGTAAAPVIFTSINDDSSGGDTNNNSSTVGKPGDWVGLQLNSDSSNNVMNEVKLLYGGAFSNQALYVDGGPLSLSNSVVSDSSSDAVRFTQSNSTLSAVTFNGNAGPAVETDLASNLTITGETAASLTGNGYNGVYVDGGSFSHSVTWDNPSIVYVLGSDANVPKGITLSIGAGQIIKSGGNTLSSGGPALTVDGTLTAQGTAAAPVIFTSINDDGSGGDTNDNGNSTSPASGDWTGLELNSDSENNVFNDVELLYAGRFGNPAIYANGGPLSLSSSVVSDSKADGVQFEQSTSTLSLRYIQRRRRSGG